MQYGRLGRTIGIVLGLAATCSGLAITAEEPAREFLDLLRHRGYYDQALEYLDQMATSPLSPAHFRDMIPLEKGITLIEASRVQRESGNREKHLDDAQRLIQQFVDANPSHRLANSARGQLGAVILERARIKVELSKKTDKAKNRGAARKFYDEAFRTFTKQRDESRKQLEGFPKFLDEKDEQQRQRAEQRDQLRSDYLQAFLMAAAVREEMTETVDAGSKESIAFLTEAASLYETIYREYRTRISGLYARMYQARCLQKLKKYREALGFLSELLDQPDTPDAFRTLRTKVLRYAMECWLESAEKKFVEAIQRGSDWLAQSRPGEDHDPDWLVLRLYLAKAYVMQADEARKANAADKVVNSALAEARKAATIVARSPSEHQAEAQSLLAQLGRSQRAGDKREAKTFEAARDFGRESIDAMEAASLVQRELPARVEAEKDSQAKAELRKQLDSAKLSYATSQQEALEHFRLALNLADKDTPLIDLNLVRYFLTYIYFTQGQYLDAAMMGEFIARRYPDHSAARQCGKIAMASYLKLYSENRTADKEFETEHLISVAEYIATSWPDKQEAEEALGTLVPFMINSGQLDRALGFLAKIPATSGRRGEAELISGQALWADCLKRTQELAQSEKDGTATDREAKQAKLVELKKQALQVLTSGYNRVQSQPSPDRNSVVALLSLAQAHIDAQHPLLAIEVLEHPKLGPMTLVRQHHPAAAEQIVLEDTYKTALRAYIAAMNVAPDSSAMVAKARETMNQMKSAITAAQGGQERVLAVFIGLARSLEDQLRVASPEARATMSQGFEAFLKQIRAGSSDFNVLNWVAETFMSLGAGLDNGPSASPDSAKYYQESRSTFEKILADTQLAPGVKTQVQIRMAAAARKQRDFQTAIDMYRNALSENMSIKVQVEAARAYQESAAMAGNEAQYERAIGGSHAGKDGKNVIWGWGRIVQVTARFPQYRDTFHEANVNLAWCRLLSAEKQQGASRDKLLQTALNGVVLVRQLYPELGGAARLKQYDAVVRRIQQAMGQAPAGLDALTSPSDQAKG